MIEEQDAGYRIGIGTDIHRIVEGRKLMLCGVYVPYPAGLAGHSDGDVGLHAVIDALLGASGMGDIGTLFPDTDPALKDVDSKELLFVVKEQLEEKKWEVINVDLIIHTEEPKLGPFKGQMKRCIAGLLDIDFTAVNVKAKTNEGLGDIGAGQAMAATATALLRKKRRRTL
ncbi:MAG TPA: 2-C-methyl-D-erythritol 2,4-cyclodiphosphate synthase [Sedimentisphaerales bacterium]|nr:2-C-methyl-D-erythritol 2,4-cyclodiphosphate synthase [Sedimentisphaerales bacterium]